MFPRAWQSCFVAPVVVAMVTCGPAGAPSESPLPPEHWVSPWDGRSETVLGEASQALPPYDLVVGSERGLEAWSRDGDMVQLITPGPARLPRWVDEDTLIVLVPSQRGWAEGFRFESIDIGNGVRRTLAGVPAFECKEEGAAEGLAALEVRDAADFRVDASGDAACVSLRDNYAAGATFSIDVRVDLSTRRIRRWAAHKPDRCSLLGEWLPSEPPDYCVDAPPAPEPEPLIQRYRIVADASGIAILDEGSPAESASMDRSAPLYIPGYTWERVSPSGSWILIHGDIAEGDYVHRSLLLVHLRRGTVYRVPGADERWPEPLARVGVDTGVATPVQGTQEAVGESTVRWLGTDELTELLVIDNLVVRPGMSAFSPEGDIAL